MFGAKISDKGLFASRAPSAPSALGTPGLPLAFQSNKIASLLANRPSKPSAFSYGGVLQMMFYGSLIIFVLFLILVFVHFTVTPVFSFSPGDNGFISIPTISDSQVAFTAGPATSDMAADFTNVPACSYSVAMDLYMSGSFYVSPTPRVIFYRALDSAKVPSSPGMGLTENNTIQLPPSASVDPTAPVTTAACPAPNGGATILKPSPSPGSGSGPSTNTSTNTNTVITPVPKGTFDLTTYFPDSNIVVWLDPMKNDLYVSVITSKNGTAASAVVQTSEPIENLPMKEVFRATIVFTQQFVEIYINGSLKRTMTLSNPPISVSDSSSFYPPTSNVMPSVFLANLTFWPRVLTVGEVTRYGKPISNNSFFSNSV